MFFHPRVGLFAGRARQPPEAVEVLISPRRSSIFIAELLLLFSATPELYLLSGLYILH